jgi:hypothetical protein
LRLPVSAALAEKAATSNDVSARTVSLFIRPSFVEEARRVSPIEAAACDLDHGARRGRAQLLEIARVWCCAIGSRTVRR